MGNKREVQGSVVGVKREGRRASGDDEERMESVVVDDGGWVGRSWGQAGDVVGRRNAPPPLMPL